MPAANQRLTLSLRHRPLADESDLHAVSARLGDVERDVAALKTLIPIVERIEARVNQPDKTNWVGIGSLLVALSVASGTYINTRLGPVESSVDATRIDVRRLDDELNDRAFSISRAETNVETLVRVSTDAVDKIGDVSEKVAALEVLSQQLEVRIEDIDTKGSRRWIEDQR